MPTPISERMQAMIGTEQLVGDVVRGRERDHVVAMASRMVDTLEGKDPNMMKAGITDHVAPSLSSAPAEVPHFDWQAALGDGFVGRVGDFGQLLVAQWGNERPSQIANASFYAGVLAAKLGLVDVDAFHRSTDDRDDEAEALLTLTPDDIKNPMD